MEAGTHEIPLLHIRKFEYWSPDGLNNRYHPRGPSPRSPGDPLHW